MFVPFAAVALAACNSADHAPADWDPLKLPPGVEQKLSAALDGGPVSFIVQPPTGSSRALGWTCGMVAPKGSGEMRFFVYDREADSVRLEPKISSTDGQASGLQLSSFMQYKQPCDD
jgi:hypothetical protein